MNYFIFELYLVINVTVVIISASKYQAMMAYRVNELKLLEFLTSEIDAGEKWFKASGCLTLVIFKGISEFV